MKLSTEMVQFLAAAPSGAGSLMASFPAVFNQAVQKQNWRFFSTLEDACSCQILRRDRVGAGSGLALLRGVGRTLVWLRWIPSRKYFSSLAHEYYHSWLWEC